MGGCVRAPQLSRSVSGTGIVSEQRPDVVLEQLVASRPSLPATLVAQSLKVVVAPGAIMAASSHATVPETVGSSRMGTGHSDRASHAAPCQNERSAVHA